MHFPTIVMRTPPFCSLRMNHILVIVKYTLPCSVKNLCVEILTVRVIILEDSTFRKLLDNEYEATLNKISDPRWDDMLVVTTRRKLKQEDCEFEASMGYVPRPESSSLSRQQCKDKARTSMIEEADPRLMNPRITES